MRRAAPLLAACLALCLGLSACGSLPRTTLTDIKVLADADANSSSGTAFDIVFAYDEASDGALPRTGAEWFSQRDALRAELADKISVKHLSLAPSTGQTVVLTRAQSKAIGVYGYANYVVAPGPARGKLTPYKHATVRLGVDAVNYAHQ